MCLVSNSQGNYITRKRVTGQLTLTDNINMAYTFSSEVEANMVVQQYGKEFGGLKIAEM